MRVLVVGEGPHELSGALEALANRLHDDIDTIATARFADPDLHTHQGRGGGIYKRAIRWILEAKKRGFHALVVVVDEDGGVTRHTQFNAAQDWNTAVFRRAFGVAVRTFDAWMLADEVAVSNVLKETISTPANPETLRNPKDDFQNLLTSSGVSLWQRDAYAQIAAILDLDQLKSRCPKGFRPFAERVEAL